VQSAHFYVLLIQSGIIFCSLGKLTNFSVAGDDSLRILLRRYYVQNTIVGFVTAAVFFRARASGYPRLGKKSSVCGKL